MDPGASAELEHIWTRVQAELAALVGRSIYSTWLASLRPLELSGGRLRLETPPLAYRWIEERFGRVLESAARQAIGAGASVELIAAAPRADGAGPGRTHATHRSDGAPRNAAHRPPRPTARLPEGPLGNPKLTFDQFVIGDSNRLAHAAALSVAELPAQAYNPLFICGPPGVGKTHLLSSIANLMLQHSPHLTVRLTTGEAFTNAFLGALAGGDTEAFKARFRDIDVLLVDDVQFLERKARTEEEFFHTFNALYDGSRQIVLTSDRPPRDLQALEDRLRERFAAGLVADISPPDLTMRLAILRKRAHHDSIALVDEQPLVAIAERVDSNVRALEGALIRVVAYSSLTGRPLDTELARELLDGLYPRSSPSSLRTIEEIQQAACAHFGITSQELLSSSRAAAVTWARQMAMYLAREHTGQSLPAIGRSFGGRDHSTVLHACRRVSKRVASDESARSAVEKLRRLLELDER